MRNILLTGGAGFIGSHVCALLLEENHNVFLIDNFKNSSEQVSNKLKSIIAKNESKNRLEIFRGDIRNKEFMRGVFNFAKNKGNPINAVFHFASLKKVEQSQKIPISYWDNNLIGTIILLKIMEEFKCKNIIFSSSASVYSSKCISPISEEGEINPINTYGDTKVAIEKLLLGLTRDFDLGWKVSILRYFNPIGSYPSGLIGENNFFNTTNIFPIICNVALNKQNCLEIFGNDWNTLDGTCIRDYIHIMDIAEGHLCALNYLINKTQKNTSNIFNLGTGKGTSILELVNTFEKVNKCIIKKKFAKRRLGDNPICFANVTKAEQILNWKSKRSLEKMCIDGWLFAKNNF